MLTFLRRGNQLFKPFVYPQHRVDHIDLLDHHERLCVGFGLTTILPNPFLLRSFVYLVGLVGGCLVSSSPFFGLAQERQVLEVLAHIVDDREVVDDQLAPFGQHANYSVVSLTRVVVRSDVHDGVPL